MTIRKELLCHIGTLEEGEYIKVNAVDTEPGYFLLTLGQNRMVFNGAELVEALSSIDYYAALFKQESDMRAKRAAAPPKAIVVEAPVPKKGKRVSKEDEGAIVLDPTLRLGPTASELALEQQTKHMQGGSLVFREKE